MSTLRPDEVGDVLSLIEGYLDYLLHEGRAQSTIDARREILAMLDRTLQPLGLQRVTRGDLQAWLGRADLTPNTRATYQACVIDAYNFWCDPDDLWLAGDNPVAGMTRYRRPRGVARPCTDEQLRTALRQLPEPVRTWVIIAAYQGLRCCEIAALHREHVTADTMLIQGKGGRPRVAPTDPRVWQSVRDFPPGPLARCARTGRRLTPSQVTQRGAYWLHKLGLPVSMHQLRHWFGTTMQREYRDIRVTQRALGHLHVGSTQIYTDATDEQERAAHACLPTLV